MELIDLIKTDLDANKHNRKGMLVLTLYRVAHSVLDLPKALRPLGYLYIFFYKVFTELILGTEIHWRCRIGPGARVFHGYGLVIHSHSIIGAGVTLRHGVTIGSKTKGGLLQAPVLGDRVNVGASAIILGGVKVGNGSVIGAGAVVVKDVPAHAVVAGNPAQVIRFLRDDLNSGAIEC